MVAVTRKASGKGKTSGTRKRKQKTRKKTPEDGLNIRQRAFADYYLECGNASEAAVKAGYSSKYAATNADKLLKNTKIQKYMQKRLEELENSRIATIEEVLEFYTSVMRGEIEDYGVEVSIEYKLKAATELAKRFNERRRMELEIARLEAARKNVDSGIAPAQDNFLDALNAIADEVWQQEEGGEDTG